MWEKVNQLLNHYLKKYKIEQQVLHDELLDILDSSLEIDEINNLTPDIAKFKRLIARQYVEQGSYLSYLKQKYLNRARITNQEMIEFLVMLAYSRFYGRLATENLFNDIIETGYKQASKELKQAPKRDISLIALAILAIPNHLGWTWQTFVENELRYNTALIMKEYLVSATQKRKMGLNEILIKQQRAHLNINEGRYSGSVESHSNFIFNQAKLEFGKEVEARKVKFIGVDDRRQTEMCHSLSGQEFYLNGWNTFKRYFKSKGGIEEVRVFGLMTGVNAPPIIDNFHYCRSTISYQVD